MECRDCRTADYIKVTKYQPGHQEPVTNMTPQGPIHSVNRTKPVVRYFCQRCGHADGESVDFNFRTPEPPTNQTLRGLGQYWETPNRLVTVQENGVLKKTHRA